MSSTLLTLLGVAVILGAWWMQYGPTKPLLEPTPKALKDLITKATHRRGWDTSWTARIEGLKDMVKLYPQHPKTRTTLLDAIANDGDCDVRRTARDLLEGLTS